MQSRQKALQVQGIVHRSLLLSKYRTTALNTCQEILYRPYLRVSGRCAKIFAQHMQSSRPSRRVPDNRKSVLVMPTNKFN